jgi:hypothetical protein
MREREEEDYGQEESAHEVEREWRETTPPAGKSESCDPAGARKFRVQHL